MTRQIAIRMSDEHYRALAAIAVREDRGVSSLIRLLIQAEIERRHGGHE